LYVQCLDGELELPDNHLESLKETLKYFEVAIENSKGKNWTIDNLPKELDTKIKIDLYLESLRIAVDKWHKEKQNKDYLIVINGLISKADMEVSNFLLAKEAKKRFKYLIKGLKGMKNFWMDLPLPINGLITAFTLPQLQYVFDEMVRQNNFLSSQKNHFIEMCQGKISPGEKLLKWHGNKSDIRYFMQRLTGRKGIRDIMPKEINGYISPEIDSQDINYILGGEIKTNSKIQNVFDKAIKII